MEKNNHLTQHPCFLSYHGPLQKAEGVWMTHFEVLLPLACQDSHFPTGPALTEQWDCASRVARIVKVQRLLCR